MSIHVMFIYYSDHLIIDLSSVYPLISCHVSCADKPYVLMEMIICLYCTIDNITFYGFSLKKYTKIIVTRNNVLNITGMLHDTIIGLSFYELNNSCLIKIKLEIQLLFCGSLKLLYVYSI